MTSSSSSSSSTFTITWSTATTCVSLMLCFAPIIEGHLEYLQKILHNPRSAHVMELPHLTDSTYRTIQSTYIQGPPTSPSDAVKANYRWTPPRLPTAYFYEYDYNNHLPSVANLSPLMHSSTIATATIPTSYGYARSKDWTPIVPIIGHVYVQQKKRPKPQPPERSSDGTQRYIDICMITTIGAYAIPTDPAGVQPFCPY